MMCIESNFVDWFVTPVFFGIVSSISFAVGLWLFQQFRYWYSLRRKFHKKSYQTFYKYFPDTAIQEVNLKVKGNIIYFDGIRLSDETPFNGQFIMNPINLKIAEGYHNHTENEGFGFMKMIINGNNEFLIESPYTKMYHKKNEKPGELSKNVSGIRVQQAFVWREK